MPNDAYAKFMLRAHKGNGSTIIGAANAKDALAALRGLHDRGMVSVTVSDRSGQSLSVSDLQTTSRLMNGDHISGRRR